MLLFIRFIFPFLLCATAIAQPSDSAIGNVKKIPEKCITRIDKKIKRYDSRITAETEKTLAKLSRWENKIRVLLQKVNPEAADNLFGNNQTSFASLLQKLRQGEALGLSYHSAYDKYRDHLTTSLKYLSAQEQLDSDINKKIALAAGDMKELNKEQQQAEALQQFIKERKKQLAEQALQYIGNSKYLIKINKEAYYYAATLKNYRALFSDPKKAEETTGNILNRIPAFRQFMQQNSQLASLFGEPYEMSSLANMAGLQTRASIQNLMQQAALPGGSRGMQQVQQNIQAAKSQVDQLKGKLPGTADGSSDAEQPDFTPNTQKARTFSQRLEYGYNLQFGQSLNLLPNTSDIAINIGYRLNDRSVAGLGAGYKLGIGNIRYLRFTNEGVRVRSFLDWKIKKQVFISGGYEINHQAQFENIAALKNYDAWTRSALIGLTKKVGTTTKWFKAAKLQLMYDFLSRQHVPVSQPLIFRVGYNIQ